MSLFQMWPCLGNGMFPRSTDDELKLVARAMDELITGCHTSETINSWEEQQMFSKKSPRFDVTLGDPVSQLTFSVDKERSLVWTFIAVYFARDRSYVNIGTRKNRIYAVDDDKIVSTAMDVLDTICKKCGALIKTLTLDAKIFARQTTEENMKSYCKIIDNCETLRILGYHGLNEKNARICSTLLNRLGISKETLIRDFPADGTLTKVSFHPKMEIGLSDATPEDIMRCATFHGVYSLKSFNLDKINRVIHMWLNVKWRYMVFLNLKIENPEVFDKRMFNGLQIVNAISQPCCGYMSTCNKKGCSNEKIGRLQNVGIKLVRKDGSEATIFYSHIRHDYSFVMLINDKPYADWSRFLKAQKEYMAIIPEHTKIEKEYRKNELGLLKAKEQLMKTEDLKKSMDIQLDIALGQFKRECYNWENYRVQEVSAHFKHHEKKAYERRFDRQDDGFLTTE